MEYETPLNVSDRTLPFHSPRLSDYDFEDLCAELFENELGIRFYRYGRRGDAQHGIDFLSESNSGKQIAIQCKKVQEFQPSDLKSELKKLRDFPAALSSFFFILACPVSSKLLDTCARESNSAKTLGGLVGSVHIWDSHYLSRVIRKYPNVVGSYFGLDWMNHLFPHLEQKDLEHNLAKIMKSVSEIKRQLGMASLKGNVAFNTRLSVAEIKLVRGIEGYFKRRDAIADFHGDMPSDRGFSFKYSIVFDNASQSSHSDTGKKSEFMLSVILAPEDVVDLEAVLVMDQNSPASVSTYYSHDILLTHIAGPCPMISLPSRDMSFMLIQQADYDELLQLVTSYLDGYNDSALAARRRRTLERITKGVPKIRALIFGLKYES